MSVHMRVLACSATIFFTHQIASCTRFVHKESSKPHYTGGVLAKDGEYPSSVRIMDGQCSGVKIAPRAFLTAAHCLLLKDEIILEAGDEMTVAYGPQEPYRYQKTTKVLRIAVHPSWISGLDRLRGQESSRRTDVISLATSDSALDLGVIIVEDDTDIPVASISKKILYTGNVVKLGGYGAEHTVPLLNMGRLRYADKIVDSIQGSYFETPSIDASEETFSLIAAGDSGGPVYKETNDGLVVVGINSFSKGDIFITYDGEISDTTYAPKSGAVRLDEACRLAPRKFLEEFLAPAS